MTAARNRLFAVLAILSISLCSAIVFADMDRKGTWPDDASERVTLSVSGTRAEAIRKLAEAAGWSLVIRGAPDGGTVNVEVKDQPAVNVLELLLSDGAYVATRTGNMISVGPAVVGQPVAAPVPPAAPATPEAPAAPSGKGKSHGKDRVVTGHSVTVGRDEVVADLTVLGGSAEVFGTVTGDISVFGGSLEVKDGAHVYGDISAVGGSVEIAPGGLVDGDVNAAGGNIERRDQQDHANAAAVAAHKAERDARKAERKAARAARHGGHDSDDSDDDDDKKSDSSGFGASFIGSLARTALLFAFGTILLALLGPQMEVLQSEFTSRPARSFALGVLGLTLGALAVVALLVTIIGIPVAIVAVLAGALGVYAGVCAVFTSLGAALLRHRSASPYVHLALGCALYWLLSAIPVVSTFVTIAAFLVGAGVLVSTRAAGLIKPRSRDGEASVSLPAG
jgi:cytoskeletal protein CcmA (bactofilin family)